MNSILVSTTPRQKRCHDDSPAAEVADTPAVDHSTQRGWPGPAAWAWAWARAVASVATTAEGRRLHSYQPAIRFPEGMPTRLVSDTAAVVPQAWGRSEGAAQSQMVEEGQAAATIAAVELVLEAGVLLCGLGSGARGSAGWTTAIGRRDAEGTRAWRAAGQLQFVGGEGPAAALGERAGIRATEVKTGLVVQTLGPHSRCFVQWEGLTVGAEAPAILQRQSQTSSLGRRAAGATRQRKP